MNKIMQQSRGYIIFTSGSMAYESNAIDFKTVPLLRVICNLQAKKIVNKEEDTFADYDTSAGHRINFVVAAKQTVDVAKDPCICGQNLLVFVDICVDYREKMVGFDENSTAGG